METLGKWLIVLIVSLQILPLLVQSGTCTVDEFLCVVDNKCIPKLWVCDGNTDCSDKSDEVDCTCSASPNQFKCTNNKCVPSNWVCDTKNDCGDGSDEVGCVCTSSQFACANKKCIPLYWVCDFKNDCGDGSDEAQNCVCDSSNGWFPCNNSNCIHSYLHCNWNNDCGDNSDESWCPCNTNDKFQCSNGNCIYAYLRCNYNNDCGDNSDERGCPCDAAAGRFRCNNTICISSSYRCNFVDNCGDNSDEDNCVKCGNTWNSFLWSKCFSAVIGEGFNWGVPQPTLLNRTCSAWPTFLRCLTDNGTLCKTSPNPGIVYDDINYYYYMLQIDFYNYACNIQSEFNKFIVCQENAYIHSREILPAYYPNTYHSPDTYAMEANKCNQQIQNQYNIEMSQPEASSNLTQCRLQNNNVICQSRTFEKFNQDCGNPNFMFYYFLYNLGWPYWYNIPYYFNYNFGCQIGPGIPTCKVFQDDNCTDIAPYLQSPILRGPAVIDRTWIEFYCDLINASDASNAVYEVSFLFDDNEAVGVPRYNISGLSGRATLHEFYLVGQMGKSVSCSVISFWANSPQQRSRSVNSINSYWIGIQPINRWGYIGGFTVYEGDWDPWPVTLKSTLPITCFAPEDPLGCILPFQMLETSDIVTRLQGFGCFDLFNESDWKPAESRAYSPDTTLAVYAVRDSITTLYDRPNTLTIRMLPLDLNKTYEGLTYPNIWSGYTVIQGVGHSDHPSTYCSSSGFLHMRTFDGVIYSAYNTGQFVYVQNTAGQQPFEVHVRHWVCDGTDVGCICGVTGREGKTILGIDMCTDGIPHYFTYTRTTLTKGFNITASISGISFGLSFPSGNKIWGSILNGRMNLDIYVTSDTQGSLEGLCGSFDGNPYNDINVRGSNKNYPINNLWTDIGPNDYMESWRIPTGKSLFDGYIPSSPPVLPKGPAREIYCHCQDGTPECSSPNSILDPTCLEHVSYCSQTLASLDVIQNWLLRPIQPRIPVKRGNVNGLLRRRRRDTGGATSIGNLDYGYDSSKFEYADANSSTAVVPILVWPTKTGITQQQAQSYCYSVLWQDSPLRNVCRQALTDDDINKVVAKCVIDIQISSDLNQARDKIPEMQNLCLYTIATTPRSSGDTNQILGQIRAAMDTVLDVACVPSDCSGKGSCVNGTCQCNVGYSGADCAVPKTAIPVIVGLVDSSTCDVHNSACLNLQMRTENVSSSTNFVCKIVVRRIDNAQETYFTNSSSFTLGATTCSLPSEPLTNFSNHANFTDINKNNDFCSITQGSPALVYTISISNDGRNFSNTINITVYDSLCYDCSTTCTAKTTSCLIRGYCFATYDPNPYVPGQECHANYSTTNWVIASNGTTPIATTCSTPVKNPVGPSTGAVVGGIIGAVAGVGVVLALVVVLAGSGGGGGGASAGAAGSVAANAASKFGSSNPTCDGEEDNEDAPESSEEDPAPAEEDLQPKKGVAMYAPNNGFPQGPNVQYGQYNPIAMRYNPGFPRFYGYNQMQ